LTIKSNVGLKIFGKAAESVCKVKFTKNQYMPGELVDIGIDCDNSKVKKDVKSYKFKLFRELRCREATSGHYDTFTTLLKTVKEKGCGAGKKEQKTFQFLIPELSKDCSEEASEAVPRSSVAVMNVDKRGKGLTYFNDDDEEP